MRRLVAALAVVLGCGCSYAFMEPAPGDWQPPAPLHCTASKGFATADGLIVAVNVISFLTSWAMLSPAPETRTVAAFGMTTSGVAAIVYGASAAHGSRKASQCRAHRAVEAAAAEYERSAPGALR